MDLATLVEQVREAYARIATAPGDAPPLPAGRALAEDVGYPPDLLDALPSTAVEAFAGVSNVSLRAPIAKGAVVLDLGCGAGLDTIVAARRGARVIGVDFCPAMLARARRAIDEAGARDVEVRQGSAQDLPVGDASIDAAMVNGLFNLNPRRSEIFRELARVVRPGGVVLAAEIVLLEPLAAAERASLTNWFS